MNVRLARGQSYPVAASKRVCQLGDRLRTKFVRLTGTVSSIAILLSGFTQAPFLHIHVAEANHPAASVAHVHVHSVQTPSSPVIEAHTPDDDAIDVEWRISAPQPTGLVFVLGISDNTVIAPPIILSRTAAVSRPRGHDPPDLTPKQPRSPPA